MLQEWSRTLFRSANRLLRSLFASTASFSILLHASCKGACKAHSRQKDSHYQPLPGWIASLTVGGVAAGVIAANLEEVPLTGRMQPRNDNTGMISKPKLISYTSRDTAYVQHEKVTVQGCDLMLGIYARAALATKILAHQHPVLRARLSTLPPTAKLQFEADQLEPGSSFHEGHTYAWYNFWSIFTSKRQFVVRTSAGMLLHHNSLNSLVYVMAHEFGHSVARHMTESDSWALVSSCAIFGRLALSGIAPMPAVALGCLLSIIARKVGLDRWLSQQQEHEADVIGAAISRVAGCSSQDILYALSCSQLLAHHCNEVHINASGIPSRLVLACLRALMPNGELPKSIRDSHDTYMVSATIIKELSTASDETLCQAQEHLYDLELSLSQSMVYLRDPLAPWIATHPHWLDRIAHVKASKHYSHVARSTMTAGFLHESRNDGQALLQAYHASSQWLPLVKSLSCDLPRDLPKFTYSAMVLARKWGQGDVLFTWKNRQLESIIVTFHFWLSSTVFAANSVSVRR